MSGFDDVPVQSQACPFCGPISNHNLGANALAYSIFDRFPVVPLHALVIPRRHATDYLMLSDEETIACHVLLREVADALRVQDGSIVAFNVGVNIGSAA